MFDWGGWDEANENTGPGEAEKHRRTIADPINQPWPRDVCLLFRQVSLVSKLSGKTALILIIVQFAKSGKGSIAHDFFCLL